MRANKKDRLLSEILEGAQDMYDAGAITRDQLREFERLCDGVPAYTGEQVKVLRSRLKLSQADLADMMNASASAVRAWEAGRKKPSGLSCKLLDVLDRKGVEGLL